MARGVTKINPGDRFGRLVAVSRAPNSPGGCVRWHLSCDCGGSTTSAASNLQRGKSRSCGCLMRELVAERRRTHGRASGDRKTPEYNAWQAMIQRCENQNHAAWKNYGGRGIAVCERWRDSFENFLSDIGERPSDEHSLDRIDNSRGYEPGNCRWATWSTQQRNRRPRPRNEEGRFV